MRPRTLGDNDDRVWPPVCLASLNLLSYAVQLVGDLGDENRVGGPGNPSVERNPAGVAPHHLNHQNTLVGLRRRLKPIKAFCRKSDSSVETEGGYRPIQVV